jgi:hypothetical protein
MRVRVILPFTMKPYLPAGCLLLVALPTLGLAQGKRNHPLPDDVPVSVLPIAAENAEARSAASLRDSLRQPFDDADNKPYRLSSQERQRMREQLRNPSVYETTKK